MASSQEDLVAEEAMILRGWAMLRKTFEDILKITNSPQTDNSELYKEALDRLNAKIAFDPHNLDLTKTVRIVQWTCHRFWHLVYIGSSRWNWSQEANPALYYYRCRRFFW